LVLNDLLAWRDVRLDRPEVALLAYGVDYTLEALRVLNTCLYQCFCADRADREEMRIR
jgi:hypothetical protein